MSSDEESVGSKILIFLFSIYLLGTGLSFPYFSYTYIRSKGIASYLIGGELYATFKSSLWPYFLITHFTSNNTSENGKETSSLPRHLENKMKFQLASSKPLDQSLEAQAVRVQFTSWNYNNELFNKYLINEEKLPLEKAVIKCRYYHQESEKVALRIQPQMLAKIEPGLPKQWNTNIRFVRKWNQDFLDTYGDDSRNQSVKQRFKELRKRIGAWINYCQGHPELFINGRLKE